MSQALRSIRWTVLPGLVLVGLGGSAAAQSADELLTRADQAWEQRAEGAEGTDARPGPAREVTEATAAAIPAAAGGPRALEAHWKHLRALWFLADFVLEGDAAVAQDEENVKAADRALSALEERVPAAGSAEDPEALAKAIPPDLRADAARLHFWSAIAWGRWSRNHGLLDAVRRGAANRIHRDALRSVALDPTVERGGAQRLLARLHATVPRVPWISGWVRDEEAIPWAERAKEQQPEDIGNRFIYAVSLWETAPDRRPEATRIAREVAAAEPRPDLLLEDRATIELARKRLDAVGADSS